LNLKQVEIQGVGIVICSKCVALVLFWYSIFFPVRLSKESEVVVGGQESEVCFSPSTTSAFRCKSSCTVAQHQDARSNYHGSTRRSTSAHFSRQLSHQQDLTFLTLSLSLEHGSSVADTHQDWQILDQSTSIHVKSGIQLCRETRELLLYLEL